jgi:hypothetical protein
MNTYLAAAGLLSFLGAVLHSALGERLIFRSLSLDSLPAVAGSALRSCSGTWRSTRPSIRPGSGRPQ